MDPITTGAAANVSSEAAKGIFQEAQRHIRYVIIYKKNVKKFKEKLKTMIAKQTSVQQDVDVARRNGEKMKANVQEWRNRVDKAIIEEEKEVTALEIKAMSKCFSGLCPNIKSRYRLSRKAEEAANTFDGLINECQFEHVGFRDVPKAIIHTDFETFESREKVFSDIMESLKDSTVRMMGIYGMPGVGKTYLVREVYRQAREDTSYDSVLMVTISQKPDIQRIQGEIAELLGLKLEEKTTVGRAHRLYERLIREKMILIILDDIWEKLDLEEVGIPFGSQHKGCKILLTSRNKNVLSNRMGATNTFQLGDLDDEEAWEFFKKMAGDSIERADLRPTAIEVAKRCAGLPLAISTVARALQNKELFVWKEALRQLQRPYSENPSGISAEVYKAIELSFNQLPDDTLKQTFLLYSLLRRDIRIEDLLRYAIGLGLINGVDTLQEARNRLLTMMSTLKESCLLRDSNTDDQYFNVHDLTYIVAKSIASKDNQMFALKEEDVLWDWPNEESMKKCNKICLSYSSINSLPDQLNCPQLFLFYLYSKDRSLTLPDEFFKEATNLKVIDLTCMQFSSLPSSICLLTSLSTLCLDHCKLGDDITIIGGLKSLEILSFIESDIKILPKEIGQLVKLKLLDVSRSVNVKTISVGVLSSLTRLEELYLGGTSIQWGQSGTASLAELNTLSRLSTLEIQLPDAKAVPRNFFLDLQKLENYKILIGKEWEGFDDNQYSRTLKLSLSTSIDDLNYGIKKLKKIEDLHLDGLKGMKIALQELTDKKSLSHLKNLHIQNGLDTEYITNGENEYLQLQSLTLKRLPKLISFCSQHKTDATSSLPQHELPLLGEKISFPCLEKLWLKSINVTCVWHKQLSIASFRNYEKLTTLKIEGCGSLKHIFSFSMAKCLRHLTDFEIIGCHSLREVILMEEIEEETQATMTLSLFPQLKSLELKDLQHLIGFFSNSPTQVIEFPTMKSLMIANCPELEGFICISSMEGSRHISSQVLFDNKFLCGNLQLLIVRGCHNLEYLFSSSLIKGFVGLCELRLIDCKNMKAVIFTDEAEAATAEELTLFVKLKVLDLRELPKLWVFWYGDNSGILFSQKVVFPRLTHLTIIGIGKCRQIWHDEATMDSFYELVFLWVEDCERVLNIFPCHMVERLEKLETLRIWGCGSLEEIIRAGDDDRLYSSELHTATGTSTQSIEIKSTNKLVFPKVYSLSLCRLPQLKCFYSKLHTTEWPSLKHLFVSRCSKVETFATELINFQETQGEKKTLHSVQQTLFWVTQETFPNLEKLYLMWNGNLINIWHGALPKRYFCNLTRLQLTSVTIPNGFIQSLTNLENLSVEKAALNGLIPSRGLGGEDEHTDTLANLKELRLSELLLTQVLCNLEILKALECSKLENLVPSSVSFKHLTTLQVSKCHEFRNLVTFTTAKSMVQLIRMTVTDCQMLEEIIAFTTDEATDGIVFSQLKSLELVNLSSLSTFCSGKYTLLFPSLEEVIIRQCPKMGIFTMGKLSTPMLHGLKSTKDEYVGSWEGDLNVTLQQLFLEKYRNLSDTENIHLRCRRKQPGDCHSKSPTLFDEKNQVNILGVIPLLRGSEHHRCGKLEKYMAESPNQRHEDSFFKLLNTLLN